MNYNFIYDEKNDTYVDVFSNRGEEIINYLSSFLKKKVKTCKNDELDKINNNKHMYTHIYDLKFTTIGKLKYNLELSKVTPHINIVENKTLFFLYILDLFMKDQLYTHISYFKFIYTIYIFLDHYNKHYKNITFSINDKNENENEDKHNKSVYDDKNILDIAIMYHQKYHLSISTLTHFITANYNNGCNVLKDLLDAKIYDNLLKEYINNQYIEKC